MSTQIQFDYTQIIQLVDDYELEISASQLHGIITGSACISDLNPQANDHLNLIKPSTSLNQNQLADLSDSLNLYFNHMLKVLDSHMFEFELALPDEDSSCEYRTEELAAWCHGFLSACGHSIKNTDTLGADATEALEDIMEIALAQTGDGEEEEIEQALAELEEYLRISVQLIFDDLNQTQTVH